jgi:hypothetical protein
MLQMLFRYPKVRTPTEEEEDISRKEEVVTKVTVEVRKMRMIQKTSFIFFCGANRRLH